MPYQTLIVSNTFKTICIKFINHYQIEWDQGDPIKISSIYQKDKKRSQRVFEAFIDSLNNIRHKLSTSKYQYPLFMNNPNKYNNKQNDVLMQNINDEPNINIKTPSHVHELSRVHVQFHNTQIKQESSPIHPMSPLSPKEASPINSSSSICSNNNNVKIKNENKSQLLKDNDVNNHQLRQKKNLNLHNFIGPQAQQLPQLPIPQQVQMVNDVNMNGNIPVHVIRNGQIGTVDIMKNVNRYSNIAIKDFFQMQRNEDNNQMIGYQMESLNGGKGPIIIKQYILFPNY